MSIPASLAVSTRVFGPAASAAISELLEIRGIRLEAGIVPIGWDEGVLHLAGDKQIEADAAVSLPKLEGPSIVGLPHDGAGFVPTDDFGRVHGLTDVYAAGDLTQFPVKQGGIAAQQADAVASAIAADAGAIATPAAFRRGRHGTVVLAPGYPGGGEQGDHLIFRWRQSGVGCAVGLHGWEPLAQAFATLRAMVRSI